MDDDTHSHSRSLIAYVRGPKALQTISAKIDPRNAGPNTFAFLREKSKGATGNRDAVTEEWSRSAQESTKTNFVVVNIK